MATQAPPVGQPGFNLYADQSVRLKGANIVLIVLPTIFVILRLVSRKISRAGYWWDDLLITVALILSYGLPTCNLVSTTHYGFGRHIWVLPIDTSVHFLKILYAFEVLWYSCAACNKLAILAFYRRIFPIAQLRIVLLIMTAIVLSFTFSCVLIVLLQCVPIHAFWNVQNRVHARCVNVDLVFIISGSVNVVIDVFVVIMPIPLLWRLRTTNSQKLVLTFIFLVSGFVCLVSIIRLVVLSRLTEADLSWNYVSAGIWTATEPAMGVVSACLPSLRPLFKKIFSGTYHGPIIKTKTSGAQDYHGTGKSPKHMWSPNRGDENDLRSFTRLEEPSNVAWGHNAHAQGGRKIQPTGAEDEISLDEMQTPSQGIRVKTEVTLISTDRLEYRDQLF